MEAKKRKKSSLYCGLCATDSEELLAKEIPLINFQDPINPAKNFAICKNCSPKIDKKFYIKEKEEKRIKDKNRGSLTPQDILEKLDKFVIGQNQAKKSLSLIISNHLKTLYNKNITKSNALIIGPTGSGKTELVRSLSKIVGLPFVVADATTFTAAGYVGEDVQSILVQLYESSGRKKSLTEKGIVFLDEIDKLASSQDSHGAIGTTAVQQSLLKMIEGGIIKLNLGDKKNGEEVYIDTSKILFICSGAFPGLTKNTHKKISLDKKKNLENQKEISINDLKKYGLIPELIGRFSVICQTSCLKENDLVSILTKTENSLSKQYQELFLSYGVNINFSDTFLLSVAKEALNLGTGARGLKSILDKKLEPYFFDTKKLSKKKIFNL